MRRHARIFAFAFLAIVVASPVENAAAETLRSFTIGTWTAEARARDGRFSHCVASAHYGSGLHMLFHIDRRYRWSIGFLDRDWRMVDGSEFDVAFSIDDGQPIRARGRAVTPTQMVIVLTDSATLFDLFRRGSVLRVALRNGIRSFNLDGTSAMLTQLHDCVRRYTQPANVANSSDGKRRAGPTNRELVQDPSLQAEAAVLLANIMAAANVSGYSIGTPEQAAKMSVHAAWTAPSVVGTLLIIPVRRVDDPEIPGIVIGTNALGCKGAFMSGSLPSDGTREVRITTTCQPSGQPLTTSYYFGIPRPKGGLYLFTTTTTRDGRREDAEQTDEIIRKATYRAAN